MATASPSGQLVLWDLEEQKLHSQLPEAHGGRVSKLHFLVHEPLLISGGADNALKMWIFDMSDGGGRLLKVREVSIRLAENVPKRRYTRVNILSINFHYFSELKIHNLDITCQNYYSRY